VFYVNNIEKIILKVINMEANLVHWYVCV